jgi:hypothetical protein
VAHGESWLEDVSQRRVVVAHIVAGEQYRKLGGQLLEVHRQVSQPGGYSFDPEGLSKHLQAGIEGRFMALPSGIAVPTHTLTISEAMPTEVDYSRKVEDGLKASKKAGYLGDFYSDITRTNFSPSYVGKRVIPMRLASFGREIGEFKRRQIFAANRLIDLGATELVALNEAYPTGAPLAEKLSIVACEHFLLGGGSWSWPYLNLVDRERCVGLTWGGGLRGCWGGSWSFLVAGVDELLVALAA